MLTIREISKRLNVPTWRIDFYVRSHGIDPSGRVGNIRVFPDNILLEVAAGLSERAPGRAQERGNRHGI